MEEKEKNERQNYVSVGGIEVSSNEMSVFQILKTINKQIDKNKPKNPPKYIS